MHGRVVVNNDRGKGPEIGNEGGLHCLQKGLSLSQTECLYIRDLVLNKDLFYLHFGTLLGPCLFWGIGKKIFQFSEPNPRGSFWDY